MFDKFLLRVFVVCTFKLFQVDLGPVRHLLKVPNLEALRDLSQLGVMCVLVHPDQRDRFKTAELRVCTGQKYSWCCVVATER